MLEYLNALRPGILDALRRGLDEEAAALEAGFPALARDLAARLYEYTARGKTIRGCLVRLGFELAGGDAGDVRLSAACRSAGAAMELFQSGLLVHDDIMDRDDTRRGAPTVHAAYASILGAARASEPGHNGASLAICAGDLAYFIGFGLLARLDAGVAAPAVSSLAARELGLVCVAQMRDVANGACLPGSAPVFGGGAEPAEDEILALYRHKTGRYTFSLPLALGCALAGADDGVRSALEAAGEALGVAFQLKDDELGLFADAAELGKPLGSDIRENKKTLLRRRLLDAADPALARELAGIFGNAAAGAEAVASVRAALDSTGALESVRRTMAEHARAAMSLAEPVLRLAPPASRAAFEGIVRYNAERGK